MPQEDPREAETMPQGGSQAGKNATAGPWDPSIGVSPAERPHAVASGATAPTARISNSRVRDLVESRLREMGVPQAPAPTSVENGAPALLLEGPPDGSSERRRFFLERRGLIIGRADSHLGLYPDIDLLPFDTGHTVSREHARIDWTGQGFAITDLGSTNGTFVGESTQAIPRQAPQPLAVGTRIVIGSVVLWLVLV